MELGAAGWDQTLHNEAAAAKDCMFVYVCDVATGWTWLCTLPLADFHRVSSQARSTPSVATAVRAGIADLVAAAAAGAPREPVDGSDWEHQLSLLLSAYAGGTKTWAAAEGFRHGGHFVVVNYPHASGVGSVLRPFAIPNTGGVLPPWQLNEYLKEVVLRDTRLHPEWFNQP